MEQSYYCYCNLNGASYVCISMNRERKTIAFMGGKKIGHDCLKFLLDNSVQLNAEVICVFENKSKLQADTESMCQLAQNQDIPVYFDQNKLLEIDTIDFIISVQYNEILKQKHINQAKEFAINLHMAPLPEYRGCNQFSFAIIDGINEFGTSLHRLETSIDGGDLIAENRFEIPDNCFVQDLYNLTLSKSFSNAISMVLKLSSKINSPNPSLLDSFFKSLKSLYIISMLVVFLSKDSIFFSMGVVFKGFGYKY